MSAVQDRARRFSMGGAVLAALAASSCCLGPLLLAAAGIGASAAGALGAFRPYLLAGTVALLALAFALTYRKPRAIAGDACGCERPRAKRADRFGVWIVTVVVAIVAAAPPLLARLEAERSPVAAGPGLAIAVIGVPGIDCEACAAPIRSVLSNAGGLRGIRLDIAKQTLTVTYEPAAGRLDSYVAAIRRVGYEEAGLATPPEARR
jgi:mercuric ion transport protein